MKTGIESREGIPAGVGARKDSRTRARHIQHKIMCDLRVLSHVISLTALVVYAYGNGIRGLAREDCERDQTALGRDREIARYDARRVGRDAHAPVCQPPPAVQKFAIARMTGEEILDRVRAIRVKGGRATSSTSGRPGLCRPGGPGSAELADEIVDDAIAA
jgi:hypothetical protein